MSSNRVGPPPPPSEPPRGGGADSKKFREELQKVQKVKEVDPDEQSRKRNKRLAAQMGDEDVPEDLNGPQRVASPFETSFYKDKPSSFKSSAPQGSLRGSKADTPVPSPAYSPPPSIDSPLPPPRSDDRSAMQLPNSDQFWEDIDLPDQPPPTQQNFRETRKSQERTPQDDKRPERPDERKRKSAAPEKEKEKTKKREPSPFGVPGKPVEEESSFMPVPMKKKRDDEISPDLEGLIEAPTEEEELSPFGKPPEEIDDSFWQAPIPKEKKKTAKETEPSPFIPKDPSLNEKTARPKEKRGSPFIPDSTPEQLAPPVAPPKEKGEQRVPTLNKNGEELPTGSLFAPIERSGEKEGGGGGGKQRGSDRGHIEIVQPSLPQLPTSVQPMAQAAATQATPYLTPDSMSLYYQMVGMIYVMTAPNGISRTEVVLNAPAFANSKFFGSTITIEKYATAPDSLNIRLTGSNEAVQAFNQNISSLVAAFENGQFKFKIGRIDTAYSIDKPVYRRKERNGDNDSGSSKDKKR